MERERNSRRDQRVREATRHIADMEARFGKEIAASVAGIKVYDGFPKVERAEKVAAEQTADEPDIAEEAAASEPAVPSVTVTDQDSVAAILELGRGRAQFTDLAVLDFASFMYAGGGYDRGAWAQEEALCAESTLYNVLATQKAWDAENRRRNVNCHLYRDRALVAPAIRFTRGKVHAYADVIVAAAPNARRAREEYRVKDDQLVSAMRSRIRLALAIADSLGHEKLVLGAFGCGVFGWNAEQVAEMFRAELAGGNHVAKQVVFAVPRTRFDENLPVFEHVFSHFPEKNPEPYAVAARRAADARAAAAASEADDEDDDWRKYL